MDPQHRLFLEVAWGAMEDAGYDSSRVPGPVAVFAGSGMSYYGQFNVFSNKKLVGEMGEWLVRHTANDRNFLATLASYKMDIRGPSMNVQTACSSALVATHMAVQSLLSGECDMAIAGGSTINFPQRGYTFHEGEILSSDGRCRAFDAKSNGTVFGSGCGAVVLRRLEDALEEGDVIDAVICGSAINNDGANKVGFLAPSVEGQTEAIAQALSMAQVEASSINFVETHGTGTVIGDPIEVTALRQAYDLDSHGSERLCGIGSVKTNIGHLGEAAGAAGLIKICLAMRHGIMPASLHFTSPNPALGIEESPFYVVDQNSPWERGPTPRRAAITALGAGGTNAHMILEEPPEEPPAVDSYPEEVLLLSAKTETALAASCSRLAEFLREETQVPLADVAFTLREGRHEFPYRRAVYCRDADEAARALSESQNKVRSAFDSAPRLTFMYPGGGAQYANMGRSLYESEPVYRDAVDSLAKHAMPLLQMDIRALMYCEKEDEGKNGIELQSPRYSLPALFATSYALSQLLLSWGVVPDAMIGHSMGEYVAACLAGVFSPEDGLALVIERGRLFEQVERGGMLAIQLSEEEARGHMGDDLGFAAINGPSLCVASGTVPAIEALQEELEKNEVDCTRVRINVAAHSHLLEPILPAFRSFCEGIDFRTPTRRFLSNLSGEWAGEEVCDPEYWVEHLRSTVQFKSGIGKILCEGDSVFLEVGPGRTLASVARQQDEPNTGTPSPPVALPTLRHPKEDVFDREFLFSTLGKVWGAGRPVDWELALGERYSAKRVHIPTYAFEHQRFWIDAEKTREGVSELTKRVDVSEWFHVPTWKKTPLFVSEEEKERSRQWLVFTDGIGVHGRVREGLNGRVISVRQGLAFSRMDADVFEVNPSRTGDVEELLSSLDMDPGTPLDVVYLWPVSLKPSKVLSPSEEKLTVACFDGLLSLLQAAADLDWEIRIHVVVNGAVSVDGERTEPEKALALGPVRVGARELAHVKLRLIDWDYDPIWDRMKEAPVDELLSELVGDASERVVALRKGKRSVESLSATRLPSVESRSPGGDANGMYLITGGFGGIGREVAKELTRDAQPTLILVGRSPLPPQADWTDRGALSKMSASLADRCRFAASLLERGAKVVAEAVDMASFESVQALVRRHPNLVGVYHTAGVLHDGPIQTKTHEEAHQVLAAKAVGARHLSRVLNWESLDHLVLFSSSSSRLGLRGQIDYTAANAYLDALAADLHARGHSNVFSINWGTWRDVGMAARLAAGGASSEPGVSREFSTHSDWVVGEHRIHGGQCVMPGTGYLDFLFSTLTENSSSSFVARDVLFQRPFAVLEGEQGSLSLRIRGDEFEFVSPGTDAPHVSGSFDALSGGVEQRIDLREIRKRLAKKASLRAGFLEQDFVDFGPRWGNLLEIAYGEAEALTEIQLPDSFLGDLSETVLHPAMLDMATGGAQLLIDDFDQDQEFFVPFSYGAFYFYRRFGAKIFSHVRFAGRRGDTAEFDVVISDAEGVVLARIDSFLMKQVDRESFGSAAATAAPVSRTSDVDSNLRALVSQGTTASEGMDVLSRVLTYRPGPQIFATPFSMDEWIAHTDELDRLEREDTTPAFTINEDTPREEPKGALERELLALWTELLGVGGLGVLDDFFELGGQSLVAARMFVRIRKKFGVSLPLSALFAAPTIRALAVQIDPTGEWGEDEERAELHSGVNDREEPVLRDDYSAIVPIQPKGSRPPFFCMPGMGGNPLGQRFLSERLGNDQPFYGLQARGVDGVQEPHTRVEEMAAEYIEAMRQVQPEGPYYFGGFSGGGVVAYEIAQQLTAAGQEVGLLALLDAYNPLLPPSSAGYKAQVHWARSKHFGTPHVAELAKWKLWHPIKRSGLLDRIQGTSRSVGASSFEAERAALDHKMMSAWIASEKTYRPEPYSGDAVLFRSEWDLLHGRVDVIPAKDNGWSELVSGDLEVVDVPGTHDSFLLEPNVKHVAKGLGARLREAVQARRNDAEPPESGTGLSAERRKPA